MDKLVLLFFGLSIALGAGRAADLALWTDPTTRLCTYGSVWLRYAALAVIVLLGVAAGRGRGAKPERLRAKHTAARWFAALAECSLCWAAVHILLFERTGIADIALAALEIVCAVWLSYLSGAWRCKSGEWKTPTKSLLPAVLGTALFYWSVLARFMENSSSWHRVSETAMVWQYLAALVFLTALARALYLPDAADTKALCGGGLCTFALCLCWQLPQTVMDIIDSAKSETPASAAIYMGLALCFIGALGGWCAAVCLRKEN